MRVEKKTKLLICVWALVVTTASQKVFSQANFISSTSEAKSDSNQFTDRYIFSPSSFQAKKHKVYYSNQNLLFNNFSYGVHKKLSLGFSFGTFPPLLFLSPKLKYTINPNGRFRFGLNVQYLHVTDLGAESKQYKLGYVNAIVTTGNYENNITVGIGKILGKDWVTIDYLMSFAATKKVSNRISFVTDNLALFYSYPTKIAYVFSAGLKFKGKKHAFDLAVITPPVDVKISDRFIVVPLVGYRLQLGK